MEKIKITGQVYHVGQVEQVSEKFKKREFVLKTFEQYPQFVLIQVVNDRCDLLDTLRLNDTVETFINIRGREWTDRNGVRKFFNTLEAWQITFANINAQPQQTAQPVQQQPAQTVQQPTQQINNDPLGFLGQKDGDPF